MPEGRQTISIYDETYAKHKERKEAMGLTWDEYLDDVAPAYPDAIVDALMDRIGDRLDEQVRESVREAIEAEARV